MSGLDASPGECEPFVVCELHFCIIAICAQMSRLAPSSAGRLRSDVTLAEERRASGQLTLSEFILTKFAGRPESFQF